MVKTLRPTVQRRVYQSDAAILASMRVKFGLSSQEVVGLAMRFIYLLSLEAENKPNGGQFIVDELERITIVPRMGIGLRASGAKEVKDATGRK